MFTIHCRIGSLEISILVIRLFLFIYYRMGSLEIIVIGFRHCSPIYCRIGSLEKPSTLTQAKKQMTKQAIQTNHSNTKHPKPHLLKTTISSQHDQLTKNQSNRTIFNSVYGVKYHILINLSMLNLPKTKKNSTRNKY